MLSKKQQEEYAAVCNRVPFQKLKEEVDNNRYLLDVTTGDMNAAMYQYYSISLDALNRRRTEVQHEE